MTPERWSLVQNLFLQAVELPLAGRESFLDAACRDDLSLREDVAGLLACDDPSTPLITVIRPVEVRSEPEWTGKRIGPYRVVRLLGRGGMGTVYLAARDDDSFHKEVAVKILPGGMSTDHLLQRFRQERQILANLEHAYIARLLDGGATADGVPYLVMEYVDGLPVDRYCALEKLSIRDRLVLFRLICEAVQNAHQNLVVHRDLKPGNILVTHSGVPKLLDFGIAKIMDDGGSLDSAGTTQPEFRMMTLEYASPEQVLGVAITTATDIYALGAVLYELLTGQRAHQFRSKSPTDIEKTICRIDPERPSVAGQNRQLSGDLDNIVLTAMQKEPNRRYHSAAELSEDLRRYLEGLPVRARTDGWTYRAGKFVRRHAIGVVAVVVLIASLAGGIVASTVQARRAERRLNLVRQLAKSTLTELAYMEQLPGATPIRASMIQTIVRHLDRLAEDAGTEPELDIELADAYSVVAAVEGHPYRQNLGQSATALAHYQKAIEIYERHAARPETRRRVLDPMVVTMIEAGDIEAQSGNWRAAGGRLKKAAAIFGSADREFLGPSTQIYVCFRLGDAESRRGAAEESLVHYRRALEIARRWSATDRGANARSTLRGAYMRVAGTLIETGDLSGARTTYETAIKLAEAAAGQPDSTEYERSNLFGALQSMGDLLGNPADLNLGDRAGALRQYRAALPIAERLAAADPIDVRAHADLAALLRAFGRILTDSDPAEALGYYRKAGTISARLSAGNPTNLHRRRAYALDQLGVAAALCRLGESLATAHESASNGLRLLQSAVDSASHESGWVLELSRAHLTVGDVHQARGELLPAESSYRAGLQTAERLLKLAPANLYFQRARADALESLGRHLRSRKSAQSAAAARECFQMSLSVWNDWIKRGLATVYAERRASEASIELAKARARS